MLEVLRHIGRPREACMRPRPVEGFCGGARSRSMTVCIDGVCLVLITTGIKHQGWEIFNLSVRSQHDTYSKDASAYTLHAYLQPHRRPSAQLMPRADDHREEGSPKSGTAVPQGLGLCFLSQARPTWCLAAAASMIAGANAGIRLPGGSHRTWLCRRTGPSPTRNAAMAERF